MEFIIDICAILAQIFTNLYMTLFLSRLFRKKPCSKKIYSLTIIISAIFVILSYTTNLLFTPYNILISLLSIYIIFYFVFKQNALRSFLLVTIDFIILIITQIFAYLITNILFKNTSDYFISNYLSKTITLGIQIILITIFTTIAKILIKKYTNISSLIDNITNKQLFKFILLLFICICPQLIIFIANNLAYPTYLLAIESISSIIISFVICTYINKSLENNKSESDLIAAKLESQTTSGLIDGVKSLKHDYNNIVQALNGYVKSKRYDELEEYVNSLLKECNMINNLELVDPKVFNNPAIYGIVGSKYFLLTNENIPMDIEVLTDISKINFPMPELSRILGILLDNAYEATKKCNNPYVRLEIKYDNRKCADVIRVINTYDTNINIDINNIYKKGFSSKEVKSGIGLWEVKKIISRVSNSQIYPTTEKDKFIQNIIIEKNN